MRSFLPFVFISLICTSPLYGAAVPTADDAMANSDFATAAGIFEKDAGADGQWKAAAAHLLAERWPKAIEALAKDLPANTKVGAFDPRNGFKDALVKSIDPVKGISVDMSGAASTLGWKAFSADAKLEVLKRAFPKLGPDELRIQLALLAIGGAKDKCIDLFNTIKSPEASRDPVEQEVARWIAVRDGAKLEAGARAAALKAAQKIFAETDSKKRSELIDALTDAPVSAEDIAQYVKFITPVTYPEQKPGIRESQKLQVPDSVSASPVDYALSVPARYSPSHQYPLIIGLHGGGSGTGSGEEYMKSIGGELKGIEAIGVCPTSTDLGNEQYWRNPKNEIMLMLLIQEMARKFPIDTNRVYLTGYSMGGIGTYFLAPRMSDVFAGSSPGAGAWCGVYWPVLLNMPVYILHGKQDLRGKDFTDFVYAQNAADCLKELKYDFMLRALDCNHLNVPPGEHKKSFEWLLTKKRDPYAKHIILASPCVKDFMGQTPASRPDRWLAIDVTGDENLEMEGCEHGGTPRIKHSIKMGVLDATWTAANQLDITAKNVKQFRVFVSPKMADLKKPLKINVNGAVAYEGLAKTSAKFLLRYLNERRDPNMVYAGEVSVDLSKPARK